METRAQVVSSSIADLRKVYASRPGLVVATAGGVVASVVIVAWLIATLVNSGSVRNTISDGVLRLTIETSLDVSRLPTFRNGTEYGFGMWLYMNEPPRTSGPAPLLSFNHQPVMELQAGQADVHVRVPVFNKSQSSRRRASVRPHGRFDHVSLKRWVHILAVHVDGIVTLFKDGEIYSVDRVDGVAAQLTGPVVVGGRPVDAYVAGVTVLNHFPTDRQVDAMYRAGPYSNASALLRLLGFTNFGFRTPVYRMTE